MSCLRNNVTQANLEINHATKNINMLNSINDSSGLKLMQKELHEGNPFFFIFRQISLKFFITPATVSQ